MNVSIWILTVVFVGGAALVLNALLASLVSLGASLVAYLSGRRRRERPGAAKAKAKEASLLYERVKALRASGNPPSWGILAASGVSLLAYYFTGHLASAGFVLIYLMGAGWYRGYLRRREGKDVWWFLLDLRTRIALAGALMPALHQLAHKGDTRTAKIVGMYLSTGQAMSGVELLDRIAKDSGLPFLDDLVARAQAATAGTLGIDDAVSQTIDAIGSEVNTRTREQLQSVPSRLTMFVFPLLLGPSLVLLLYPIVARLMLAIAGDPGSLGAP